MSVPHNTDRSGARWAVGVAIALVAQTCVIVGIILGTRLHPHPEWAWDLAIVGSGLTFLAAAPIRPGWSIGLLRTYLGALTIWVFSAAVLADVADRDKSLHQVPLAIGVFGSGIVVFFGVLYLSELGNPGFSDSAMRHAFGASFLVVFFALLSVGVFHDEWKHAALGTKLTDQLVTLFGVIVAFYFGSTAAVEYGKFRETEKTKRETAR